MKPHRFMGVLVFTILGMSSLMGQTAVRLQFEIVKNGTLVAAPEVTVASGAEGSMTVEDVGRISFTPTLRSSDTVAVDFVIDSGGKHLQPRLVLGSEPGSMSWKSNTGGDAFVIRVRWSR